MESFEWTSQFNRYTDLAELPEGILELMHRAEEARENAYAPYSQFKVGAAALLDNGQVVVGNNQENGAFPSGICAERVALFAAGSEYPEASVLALFITARAVDHDVEKPVAPCGACRQVMVETELRQQVPMRIFFRGNRGPIVESLGIESLLPFLFKFGDWE